MLNSKVIDILKTFSADERKRFGEFLESPFHNKNKKAILLFNLLSEFHSDYKNPKLTKEYLFGKIFSGGNKNKPFNDASIRNLLSDLLILAEKFLSHIRFEKDSFDFYEKCLREMVDRKLESVFDKKIKSAEEVLNFSEFTGEEYFYHKYVLEELKSFSSQFADNLKLYKDGSLKKASEYLSYFFLIRNFKMVNFFEFQKMYNVNHETNIAEKIISNSEIEMFIEKNPDSESQKIMMIYYKMYKALSNPEDDGCYFDYKNNLLENDYRFSMLEKYGLYVCLTNSCIQKIDIGKDAFFKECFDVYKIMFEKDLFSAYSGYFAMTTFSAIVNTGIAAKEFDRVEKFIYEYSEKVNPEHKEDALSYSLAQLNFGKKNFSKALEFISKTNTEFSNFKFHLKLLSMKIYFELGDYDSLYYAIDSFQHFINKNKIVGKNYKNEFNNFTRILDLIVKHKHNPNEKLFYKIKMQLENKSIAGRRWLIEKFDLDSFDS